MIITLSDEFDALDTAGWVPYLGAIENLITAHIQGWHILVLSRSSLNILLQVDGISHRHKLILSVYIGEKLSTLAGQAASVSKKIVCVMPSTDTGNSTTSTICMSISVFEDLETCFKSMLVVENADADGRFYVQLARLLSSDGQMVLPLAFDYTNGGGSTTAAQIKRLVQSPRPLLAVVDSDKTHPDDREGDTARQVRSVFAEAKIAQTHNLIVIPVRAAENFVPPMLGEQFLAGKPQSVEVCSALATLDLLEIEQCVDPMTSVICYINIKKGVKVGSYRKGNAKFRESVNSLAGLLGIVIDAPADNDNARDEEFMIPGVNSKFLDIFLAELNKDHFHASCKDAFSKSRSKILFGAMLNEIVAYGMSGGRIPVSLSSAA